MGTTNIQETIEGAVPSTPLPENSGLFVIQSVNEWMIEASKQTTPKMLFDKLWFEGELCISFADTNIGKSILAVQIANSISKGEPIEGFLLEAEKQRLALFDFELSKKQFEARYSQDYENRYVFDDDFKRVEMNPDMNIPDNMDFDTFLTLSLESIIVESGVKIIIIDNITYLKNGTETAKDALPLMKLLKGLKLKYGLSMLILAHTPKRNLSKPLDRNDLQGSKMLINFCDSSFAIGESALDTNVRYIKQIKQRNTSCVYGAENVALFEIEKPSNFLRFRFIDFGNEQEHLKVQTKKDTQQRKKEAEELKSQGLNNTEIGKIMGVSEGAVRKWFR